MSESLAQRTADSIFTAEYSVRLEPLLYYCPRLTSLIKLCVTSFQLYKLNNQLGVVVYACHSSTRKAEAGGLQWAKSQPVLYSWCQTNLGYRVKAYLKSNSEKSHKDNPVTRKTCHTQFHKQSKSTSKMSLLFKTKPKRNRRWAQETSHHY